LLPRGIYTWEIVQSAGDDAIVLVRLRL